MKKKLKDKLIEIKNKSWRRFLIFYIALTISVAKASSYENTSDYLSESKQPIQIVVPFLTVSDSDDLNLECTPIETKKIKAGNDYLKIRVENLIVTIKIEFNIPSTHINGLFEDTLTTVKQKRIEKPNRKRIIRKSRYMTLPKLIERDKEKMRQEMKKYKEMIFLHGSLTLDNVLIQQIIEERNKARAEYLKILKIEGKNFSTIRKLEAKIRLENVEARFLDLYTKYCNPKVQLHREKSDLIAQVGKDSFLYNGFLAEDGVIIQVEFKNQPQILHVSVKRSYIVGGYYSKSLKKI